jgi:ABC-type multidrug transport system ATPase subunit
LKKVNNIFLDKFEIDYGNQFVTFPKIQLSRDLYPTKIIGENGCGKSSFVLSLARVIPEYIFGNPNIEFNLDINNEIIPFPTNQIHFRIIPQKWKYGILGFYPFEEVNLVNSTNQNWKKKVISELGINKLNNISTNYLSDGEKKRVLICKTLCASPSLIISDEWTSHLDNYWIDKIQLLFNQYFTDGGYHLEFHSEISKSNSDILIKTNQTNSVYLRDKTIDHNFFNKVLESSLKQQVYSLHRSVSYFGDNKNKSIDIEINSGQLIQLNGRNGAGKTTLIKNLWKDSFYLYRRILKSIDKKPNLLYIPTDPSYHIIGPTIKDEYKRIIGNNLEEEAKHFFENLLGVNTNSDVLGLSFGQRKLFAITLSLLSSYSIICIDEAFAGLDNENQKIVSDFFNSAILSGKTIIITDQENRNILNSTNYQV